MRLCVGDALFWGQAWSSFVPSGLLSWGQRDSGMPCYCEICQETPALHLCR